MTHLRFEAYPSKIFAFVGFALAALVGCTGDDGSQGPAGPAGGVSVHAATATALNTTITGVTVASPPVVTFRVTNENGVGVFGLTLGDLRFTVAKLVPGSAGDPSAWQNYINTTATGATGTATQATRENNGTLVDNGDGTYRYTFKTDITNVTSPIPVSYDSSLTHRVGIQTRGALPAVNAVYTFRPSDGATSGIFAREIVKTGKCNECHDRIVAHDARIETKYCVLCHNPGSSDPDTGNIVDFKVMIHKIHRGADLPSVLAGTPYQIIGFGNNVHDFSTIAFPQDIRNCTKCHDGADADTPQGNNWYQVPTKEACSSCHDNVDFATGLNHMGGIATNSQCLGCHSSGGQAGPVQDSHTIPGKVAAARFKFEILEICGAAVGSNPVCAPGSTPTVRIRVSDPTGGTHAFGTAYNILAAGGDPEFATTGAALSVDMAWDTRDYNNVGNTNPSPISRANTVNARSSAANNGDGTFTVTMSAIPDGTLAPNVAASGSGTVAIEGRPLADVATPGTFADRATVKAAVATFRITDATAKARRQVVNITTKCDRCHDLLSFHGSNRSDEAQLCVMCHNPNNTDYARRPKDANGLLIGDQVGQTLDGKKEESIDFKRMIHGIHSAAKTNFDGTIAHGFRNQGMVIAGTDFSHIRFPGVLSKCETCHLPDTFKLMDRSAAGGANWEQPAQNGILGSTISSIPNATDAATVATGLKDASDNLRISPTASVCSACHDGVLAREHMINIGGALFGATQAQIINNFETCALCHGPGRIASVEFVHDPDFGADIP